MSENGQRGGAGPKTEAASVVCSDASKRPLTIAIIDDHPMLCVGLVESIDADPGMHVIAVGKNASDAIRIVADEKPQLIIVDINMPGDGLAAVRAIASDYPDVKIIVLTAYDDRHCVSAALKNGAHVYVLKGISASKLLDTIRRVMSTDVVPKLAAEKRDVKFVKLRKCEDKVLKLVSAGLSNKEVANILGLHRAEVEEYMNYIMQRVEARTPAEAAVEAASRRIRFH